MRICNALMGIAVLGASFYVMDTSAAVTTSQRAYAAGKYALELGGAPAGWVASAEGGNATSDVINEKPGPDHIARKHIGAVKYEPFKVEVGTEMSKAFYDWIKSTFDLKSTRMNGALVTTDFNFNATSQMDFTNALITEIGFPALDAASKDAAKLTVKFAPEVMRMNSSPQGKVTGSTAGIDRNAQKKWLPSNFRLTIAGLDCARVTKIEPLVIKQKVVEDAVGAQRDYQKEAASVEFPNLVVTLAESSAKTWYEWHKSFVVGGSNAQDKEKTATLELLAPDLKEVFFTLTFRNTGIFRLVPEKTEAGSEQNKRVKAEMYVEKIDFAYGPTWQ
jgi:hypothetical protein